MTSSTPQTVAEQNPVEVPLYTPWDAARYLRLSPGALFALLGRVKGGPKPGWLLPYFWGGFPTRLVIDDALISLGFLDEDGRIPFLRFTDLFVRAAVLQSLAQWQRAGDGDRNRWANLCKVLGRGLEDTQEEPVPYDSSPIEKRVSGLVEPYAERLAEEEVGLLRKWLTLRLERVEAKDGMPVRIYPFSRDPAEKSPRMIVLDPRLRFGRPTLVERGIPTDSLFERYQAGDSIAELAEDYEITQAEVEEAIRYESIPVAPLDPFCGW